MPCYVNVNVDVTVNVNVDVTVNVNVNVMSCHVMKRSVVECIL